MIRYGKGIGLAAAVIGATLSGCDSTKAQPTTQSAMSGSSSSAVSLAAAPMDLADTYDSRWEYLRVKYDADGDDVIIRAEYLRQDGAFERLDQNDDGRLDAEDFETAEAAGRGGGRGSGRRGGMRAMGAQGVVAMYFQFDEETGAVRRGEIIQAVTLYDANGDGRIDADEFADIADDRKVELPGRWAMMERMMEDRDPWEMLVETIDEDGDGHLTEIEIIAFFDVRDDGDGVWTLQTRGRRGGGTREKTGPAEGTMAPDFMLQPPNGSVPVSLSAFRGKRPVALVFGSYT